MQVERMLLKDLARQVAMAGRGRPEKGERQLTAKEEKGCRRGEIEGSQQKGHYHDNHGQTEARTSSQR
jgi:hypothetical protein